jgi:SAM-dependent methyltransferase
MKSEKPNYLKQASEYTSFYKKLAVLVAPYLDSGWSVADIACGDAEVDIELAEYVNSISAVDRDPLVLAKINTRIDNLASHGREAISRIDTLQADAEVLPAYTWDALLFSFYMPPLDKLVELFAHAHHRCILIVHEPRGGGRFDSMPEYLPLITADELDEWLKTSGYYYNKEEVTLQFGQPFKSIDDVHLYIKNYVARAKSSGFYDDNSSVLDSERLMLSIEDSITKTDRLDFPYYLPYNFHVKIFIVNV